MGLWQGLLDSTLKNQLRNFRADLTRLKTLSAKRYGSMGLSELEAKVAISSPEEKLRLLNANAIKQEISILNHLFSTAQADLQNKEVQGVISRIYKVSIQNKYNRTITNVDALKKINARLNHFDSWFGSFAAVADEYNALLKVKGDQQKIIKLEKQLLDRYEYFKGLVMKSLERTIDEIGNIKNVHAMYGRRSIAASLAFALLVGFGGQFASPSAVFAQEAIAAKTEKSLEDQVKEAEDAVIANPQNAEARYKVAELYETAGFPDKAKEQMGNGITLDIRAADKYANAGNKEEAAALYFRASQNAEKIGNYDNSLEYFKKAVDNGLKGSVRQENTEASAHNNTGVQLLMKENYVKAEEEIKKAIELDPGEAKYHHNLGLAYEGLKRYEEAIKEFNDASKLDPSFQETYRVLSFIYRTIEKYDKSIVYAKKALMINPNDPTPIYSIAFSLDKLGKYKDALKYYDEYLKLNKSANALELRNKCAEKANN